MRYGKIDGLSKPVSKIILGGSGAAMRKGKNQDEILDFAFASGVNTFDTARGYGESEKVIGGWINRRAVRDKVTLITKGALHGLLGNNRVNEKSIRADFKKSLGALGTDYIDIYLLHRDNPKREVGQIVELLNEFRDRGLVKIFGVSNWEYGRIISANEYAYKHNLFPLSVSEPHFALAEAGRWTWIGCTSVTGAAHAEERKWYARTGFPLFAFSPLCGGFLSGAVRSADKSSLKNISRGMRVTFNSGRNFLRLGRLEELSAQTGYTVAQLALVWILSQDINAFAITGGSRVKSIESSIAAAEISLTPEQLEFLNLD